MTYSIIGSGNVGTALARQFARSGIAVGLANTRGPASIAELCAELGEHVSALSLRDALTADVIILAIPFRAHPAVAAMANGWQGKIVIDAMNTYGMPVEELQRQASSDVVAGTFTGAALVKTFNQLPARLLAQAPAEHGGRRVMFVSSNDDAAAAEVANLVERLGFAAIGLGKIREGGALLGMGGALILQNLVKQA